MVYSKKKGGFLVTLLKAERKKRGISQKTLAALAEISLWNLQKLEAGKEVSLKVLGRVALALDSLVISPCGCFYVADDPRKAHGGCLPGRQLLWKLLHTEEQAQGPGYTESELLNAQEEAMTSFLLHCTSRQNLL